MCAYRKRRQKKKKENFEQFVRIRIFFDRSSRRLSLRRCLSAFLFVFGPVASFALILNSFRPPRSGTFLVFFFFFSLLSVGNFSFLLPFEPHDWSIWSSRTINLHRFVRHVRKILRHLKLETVFNRKEN